jgi:hypothetical protein
MISFSIFFLFFIGRKREPFIKISGSAGKAFCDKSPAAVALIFDRGCPVAR